MEFKHYSVMLKECMEGLNIKSDGTYFDGTLGGGGHTEEILKLSSPKGIVVAVDRDLDAIEATTKRLESFGNRLIVQNDNFKNIAQVLENLNISEIDGAILDLGVSSYQLDNFNRGFSYRAVESPLDMRMDANNSFSAYTVVNEYDFEKLMKIFFEFGEEKFSRRIASDIVKRREVNPIKTCGELVDIITNAIPAPARRTGGHPAKRVFQAIRIEVNKELEGLDKAVMDIVSKLKVGGRLCVLTFHSLEDRIVKHAFKELEKSCICDSRAPICNCSKRKEINIITKKPIVAGKEELDENSRSQSAKLRICEKI